VTGGGEVRQKLVLAEQTLPDCGNPPIFGINHLEVFGEFLHCILMEKGKIILTDGFF